VVSEGKDTIIFDFEGESRDVIEIAVDTDNDSLVIHCYSRRKRGTLQIHPIASNSIRLSVL
jgi:hypothetical protein